MIQYLLNLVFPLVKCRTFKVPGNCTVFSIMVHNTPKFYMQERESQNLEIDNISTLTQYPYHVLVGTIEPSNVILILRLHLETIISIYQVCQVTQYLPKCGWVCYFKSVSVLPYQKDLYNDLTIECSQTPWTRLFANFGSVFCVPLKLFLQGKSQEQGLKDYL